MSLETDIEELLVRSARKYPIDLEEKIGTLDKPLILECACPGWQPKFWGPPRAYPIRKPPGYKEGGLRFPAVPCEIEEQAQVIIESVKAGAAGVHIHPRDPEDCIAINDVQLMKQVYDKIFEEVDCSIEIAKTCAERFPQAKIEVHVDVGKTNRSRTRIYVDMLRGWVTGMGYLFKVKPYSWASDVAVPEP